MIDVWYMKWRKKQTRCPHPADETLERSAFISSDVELISSSRAGRHFNAAVLRAAAVDALLAGIMSRQVSSFCQSQPTSVTCRVNYINIYIHECTRPTFRLVLVPSRLSWPWQIVFSHTGSNQILRTQASVYKWIVLW